MTSRIIDSGRRRLLLDQVRKLNESDALALPLGCDYNALRGNRWKDRLTGVEYLRTLPILMSEDHLGLSPQTLVIFDSVLSNLGEAGSQFAIDFCDSLVKQGGGFWSVKDAGSASRSRKLATWICLDEKFGASTHTIFGRDEVLGIGEVLKSGGKLHSSARKFALFMRSVAETWLNKGGRPKYDPTANWSVANTSCRELLPQLGGLKSSLFKLLQSACVVQENADSYAQLRFKHPVYWTPLLADRGSKIRDSSAKHVLSYASEALSVTAVVLATYACSLEYSGNDKVEKREGYLFVESLNCLARAHALRVIKGPDEEDNSVDFNAISSPEFDRAYIEAYAAIGASFKEILLMEQWTLYH